MFVVQGGGTELAACPVNYGTAQKLEAWIGQHPAFRGNASKNAPGSAPRGTTPVDIADQLSKLAQLRSAGVLSQEEFDRAKAKLLD